MKTTTAKGQTRPEIVRRRVRGQFSTDPAGGKTQTLNAVSFVLPAGEAYVLGTLRNCLDQVTDPVLRHEVDSFIHQETMHMVEHGRANKVLRQAFPFGDEVGRMIQAGARFSLRVSPKPTQLALSAAIEHLTALLADDLLRTINPETGGSDPAVRDLFYWHAAEEIEHKAVAFDVYQHVCGKGLVSYLRRVVMMAFISLYLLTLTVLGFAQMRLKKALRAPHAPGRPELSKVAGSISPKLYFEYYKPGFHPWDQDNAHLLEAWKRAYPGFGVDGLRSDSSQ